MKVDIFFVMVDVDDINLDSMLDSSNVHNVSNNKTLKGKVTNQGAWELMAPICHEDVYEQSFSITSFVFQLIKMSEENFSDKLFKLQEKKVRRNLIHD